MFDHKIKKKESLVGLSLTALTDLAISLGEQSYRGSQLFEWLYVQRANSFHDMQNIPKTFRENLEENFAIHPLQMVSISGSQNENTRKFVFRTENGHGIESVLMQEKKRITICISSQVGCAVDCGFCATGSMGFLQNLSAGEIVDQVLQLKSHSKKRMTNVVFMGMGEPFLNFDRVMQAAQLLNDKKGLNFGARRLTVSTAGIIPKIRQFADRGYPFKLAISLNGTNQEQREKIMPLTRSHPLEKLMESAKYYYQKRRRMLTFEYVLLNEFNDTVTDARNLIRLIGTIPCKVNVIPYNEIGGRFTRPSDERIDQFLTALDNAPFTVTVRWSKGTDIDAGCGQLAIKN